MLNLVLRQINAMLLQVKSRRISAEIFTAHVSTRSRTRHQPFIRITDVQLS